MALFIYILLAISGDQFTKYLAVKFLKNGQNIKIIENFLEFSYVENFGAGFGILQNKKFFLIGVTALVILFLIFFLYRNYHRMNTVVKISFASLIAGSLGNLIDRIRIGYVVDFISVKFGNGYNFPVFNIADILVVIGTILIIITILFDKDFDI